MLLSSYAITRKPPEGLELKKEISKLAFVLIAVLAITLSFFQGTVKAANITYSNAVFANGLVYVGSSDGYIYALNAANGEGVWTTQLSSGGPKDLTALAASDKVVVVALANSNMAGLNASTGKVLWTGGTYGANSDPIMAGGLVYFSSIDRHLYALNEETGTIAWYYGFDVSPNISINLAVVNGVVGICDGNGVVRGVNAVNGASMWNYSDPYGNKPLFLAGGNNAFYASALNIFSPTISNMSALDSATGTLLWYRSSSTAFPRAADNMVYVSDLTGQALLGISAATGQTIWLTNFTDTFRLTPSNNVVYVSSGTQLYAVYGGETPPLSGSMSWPLPFTTTGNVSDPAINGNTIYVSSSDGKVYSIDVNSGNQVWVTSAPFTAPTPTPTDPPRTTTPTQTPITPTTAPTPKPTHTPTPTSTSKPTLTSTPAPTSTLPSQTPQVPEFSTLSIPLLAIILTGFAAFLFMKKREKLRNQQS